MLNYSFATVLMALLTSNILLLLISFIFHFENILTSIGYKLLGLFLILTAIRLLFPFELPITTNIRLPVLLSIAVFNICCTRLYIGNIQLGIWDFLLVLWIIGIIYFLIQFIRNYQFQKNYITKYGTDMSNQSKYKDIIVQICNDTKMKNRFKVIEIDIIQVPMVCYFSGPCIIMPTSLNLSEQELYYILRHEMLHFYHHDLLLKFGMNMVSIIYWWNPISRVLKRQADILLEMRVDQQITQNDDQIKLNYLQTLIQVAKQCYTDCPLKSGLSFCKKNDYSLTKRFQMLMFSNQAKHNRLHILFLITVGVIYLFSIFFIFEADYIPPSMAETMIVPTAENTYAIKNSDGTYTIHINDDIVDTTDSLEYYPEDMMIYEQEKTNE